MRQMSMKDMTVDTVFQESVESWGSLTSQEIAVINTNFIHAHKIKIRMVGDQPHVNSARLYSWNGEWKLVVETKPCFANYQSPRVINDDHTEEIAKLKEQFNQERARLLELAYQVLLRAR